MKVPVCRGAAGGGGAKYFCNLLLRGRCCGARGPVRGRLLLPRLGLEGSPPPRAGTQPGSPSEESGREHRVPPGAGKDWGLGAVFPPACHTPPPPGWAAEPKRGPPRAAPAWRRLPSAAATWQTGGGVCSSPQAPHGHGYASAQPGRLGGARAAGRTLRAARDAAQGQVQPLSQRVHHVLGRRQSRRLRREQGRPAVAPHRPGPSLAG